MCPSHMRLTAWFLIVTFGAETNKKHPKLQNSLFFNLGAKVVSFALQQTVKIK